MRALRHWALRGYPGSNADRHMTAGAGDSADALRGACRAGSRCSGCSSSFESRGMEVNARRLELLAAIRRRRRMRRVLVIDDSGDARTDRRPRTWASVAGPVWQDRQRGGHRTTVWADERLYYPVHAVPTRRRSISRRGRTTRRSAPSWPSARTWRSGQGRGVRLPRGLADSAYGDQDGFRAELAEAGCRSYGLKPRRRLGYGRSAHVDAHGLCWTEEIGTEYGFGRHTNVARCRLGGGPDAAL